MRFIFKFFIAIIILGIFHTAFAYHPVILASFDDAKYVDGEVFTPVNGSYDFRKFTLNSSQTENYTAIIDTSGFAQFVDCKGNHTINVFEWDKMTSARMDRINSLLMTELNRPHFTADGVEIINTNVLSAKFYGAHVSFPERNIEIYIATPTVNETVEMVKTLKFKDSS